jgi:hypothetical protein
VTPKHGVSRSVRRRPRGASLALRKDDGPRDVLASCAQLVAMDARGPGARVRGAFPGREMLTARVWAANTSTMATGQPWAEASCSISSTAPPKRPHVSDPALFFPSGRTRPDRAEPPGAGRRCVAQASLRWAARKSLIIASDSVCRPSPCPLAMPPLIVCHTWAHMATRARTPARQRTGGLSPIEAFLSLDLWPQEMLSPRFTVARPPQPPHLSARIRHV